MRPISLVLAALLLTVLLHAPGSVDAFSADEALDDSVLEARALKLHDELRCPVCVGQAISDSNAELARDLRRLVRERIAGGDSDAALINWIDIINRVQAGAPGDMTVAVHFFRGNGLGGDAGIQHHWL